MSNVINFSEALLRKRDQEFEQRQVLNPGAFTPATLSQRESEAIIDQAIFDFEVARARWRASKNVT